MLVASLLLRFLHERAFHWIVVYRAALDLLQKSSIFQLWPFQDIAPVCFESQSALLSSLAPALLSTVSDGSKIASLFPLRQLFVPWLAITKFSQAIGTRPDDRDSGCRMFIPFRQDLIYKKLILCAPGH